ncbi:MAG TPA: hypothetical protein VN633_17385 [Bryobacteraceae bacterium]|nr:hypothetical protein [Bryobacteraceae bacterium]
MRTTINLPDDVYDVVRSFAEGRRIPMGEAVAELVRKGLRPESRIRAQDLFPVFTVPDGAAPITLERTLSAEDEV